MTSSPIPALAMTARIRRAIVLGHGAEVRSALARLEARLRRGAVTLLGPLAPDAALCESYRRRGLLEGCGGGPGRTT